MSRPIQASIRTNVPAPSAAAGGLNLDVLREAYAHWATGVAILSVTDGDEVDAITVSAFTPVSVDPPLVLACIGVHASVLPMLREVGRFTVNLLADDARAAASRVAGRLPLGDLPFSANADAVLDGSLVSLVCRLREVHDGGDHEIVVGEVERVELGRDAAPLLYYRRDYRAMGGPTR